MILAVPLSSWNEHKPEVNLPFLPNTSVPLYRPWWEPVPSLDESLGFKNRWYSYHLSLNAIHLCPLVLDSNQSGKWLCWIYGKAICQSPAWLLSKDVFKGYFVMILYNMLNVESKPRWCDSKCETSPSFVEKEQFRQLTSTFRLLKG